jgi:hypothetical protein
MYINLFYVLNDSFIMYKRIYSELFECADAFVKYIPPSSYDVGTSESFLDVYTENGKELRKQTSYFITGNKTDSYFLEQITIAKKIEKNNKEKGIKQSIRFSFGGDINEMDENFNGNAYSIYADKSGIKRLFTITNNKLYIKRSGDFIKWVYDVKGAELHKDFYDEILNEGNNVEVKNIQIVRDYYDSDTISLLYFHNEMLFMRKLQSNVLFSKEEGKVDGNSQKITNYISVSKSNGNKPIFLVGILSDKIKQNLDSEELAITIPYPEDMINKFNENFALDVNTQVVGYKTNSGFTRIFYKDSQGQLQGIILNGNNPILECMLELKGI